MTTMVPYHELLPILSGPRSPETPTVTEVWAMIRQAETTDLAELIKPIGDDVELWLEFIGILLSEDTPMNDEERDYLLENGKTCPVWARFHQLWAHPDHKETLTNLAMFVGKYVTWIRHTFGSDHEEITKIKRLLSARHCWHLAEAEIYDFKLGLIAH